MPSSAERILSAINRKKSDRLPMMEIGFWKETIARWRKEGLDAKAVHVYAENGAAFYSLNGIPIMNEIPPYTVDDVFHLDRTFIFDFDCSLRMERKTIAENDDQITVRDENGVTSRAYKNTTSPPSFLDTLVKEEEDWNEVKELLQSGKSRYADSLLTMNRSAAEKGYFCVVSPLESYWFVLNLLGEVNCLMKTALEPGFLQSIFVLQTEFQLQMLELMLGEGFIIHALWYFSDLCYKNGMLFSPSFYTEVLMPLHKRVFDFCHVRNIKIIYHSDGDIRQLLPLLIEAGIDCIQPMEARQGNNVIDFKKQYGSQISFMGNINADVLGTTKDQIEREVAQKVKAASENGGYIFHSDHSVPPSVSLENYTHAVETARKAADF